MMARRSDSGVVLGPCDDGGYYLLATSGHHPILFENIGWGTGAVAAETRARASAAKLRIEELEPWYDVDDMAGLERLRAEMATTAARRRAPATARLLDRLDSSRETVL